MGKSNERYQKIMATIWKLRLYFSKQSLIKTIENKP